MTASKRQLRDLRRAVARVHHSDRVFFERFPHRSYRVRLASEAEIELAARQGKAFRGLPPGVRYYTAVHQPQPGMLVQVFPLRPADSETDLSEDEARGIFMDTAIGLAFAKSFRWPS
jgi:hypothetical protein